MKLIQDIIYNENKTKITSHVPKGYMWGPQVASFSPQIKSDRKLRIFSSVSLPKLVNKGIKIHEFVLAKDGRDGIWKSGYVTLVSLANEYSVKLQNENVIITTFDVVKHHEETH